MKGNLSPQKDRNLGLETIAALATQAKEQHVQADPRQIAQVGNTVLSTQELSTQKTNADAWDALINPLNYYSAPYSASLP